MVNVSLFWRGMYYFHMIFSMQSLRLQCFLLDVWHVSSILEGCNLSLFATITSTINSSIMAQCNSNILASTSFSLEF